jgi:hypothetical protein
LFVLRIVEKRMNTSKNTGVLLKNERDYVQNDTKGAVFSARNKLTLKPLEPVCVYRSGCMRRFDRRDKETAQRF